MSVPMIAITFVNLDSVGKLLAAGAYRVAVVSALSYVEDPFAATEKLLRDIDRSVGL